MRSLRKQALEIKYPADFVVSKMNNGNLWKGGETAGVRITWPRNNKDKTFYLRL